MSRTARLTLFAVSAAGLGALLLWAVAGLPDFGHYHGPYGYVLNQVAPAERHVSNVVAATVFDYRGFDTLGEELILVGAVAGTALLLALLGGALGIATARMIRLRERGTLEPTPAERKRGA